VRALGLLPIVTILPHKLVKKETTPSSILVSLVEYLVITTLEELVDPIERTKHQGELPPVEENLDSEGEDFQFSNKEHPDYKEYFNGEGEYFLD